MTAKTAKQNTKRNKNTMLAEAIVEVEETATATKFSTKLKENLIKLIKKRHMYRSGLILVAATVIGNFLNYLFNIYLGNVLSLGDFALIGLVGSFFSFASIPFGAYATTVTYKSSFLMGKYDEGAGLKYWHYITKKVRIIAFIVALVWLVTTPLMMQFFHTNNAYPFLFFSLVLLVGFFNNINQGFLAAKMMFGSLAILSLADPIVRLLTAFTLVTLGLKVWTFSAVPLASVVAFPLALLLILKQIQNNKTKAPIKELQHFSKRFFTNSLLTTFSSLAFFTFDIFLANHFLSPTDAGRYTLVSLVGKMIYFLGNLTSPFVIPLLSRSEGAQKNSSATLYMLLGFTALFALGGFIVFGVLSPLTIPILFRDKALSIIPYLPYFSFGMMCYTISSVFISYYLVRKIYTFTIATSLLIFFQVGLISLFHDSVQSITMVMATVLSSHLLLTVILHLNAARVKKFEERFAGFLHKPDKKSQKTLYAVAKKKK